MNSKFKKLLKAFSNTLLGLVVVLALLLYGTKLIGLNPYSVLSGSMQSVYPTGSLLYTRNVDPKTLEAGDIITFRMNGGVVCTHRIIELVPDNDHPHTIRFRTKGDENDFADNSLVEYDDVIGKAMFCIPFFGYLATYMAVPPGKYVAIAVAAAIILIEIIISIILDGKPQSAQN